MVYQNYLNNSNIRVLSELGGMQVIEHKADLSVIPSTSKMEYFSAKMNVTRKQVILNLNGNTYIVQRGAMQWMSGNVSTNTGVTGVGNFLGKMVSGAVTGESAIKPIYQGQGQVMLEPTYRHILLTDVGSWGGSIVLDDGLFLACDGSLKQQTVARSNLSSAIFGKEGLFNLSLIGNGVVALESIVPMQELIEINLQNDVMKIDGNMAIAWSGGLEFTVERSGKSLIGSAASGEGLVNVYRGTGRIWMAPVMAPVIAGNTDVVGSAGNTNISENAQVGQTGSTLSHVANILGKFS